MEDKKDLHLAKIEMLDCCAGWDNESDALNEAFERGRDFEKKKYKNEQKTKIQYRG